MPQAGWQPAANPARLSGAGFPSLATCPVLATPDSPQVRGPGWWWAEVGLTALSRWCGWSEPLPRLPLSCRLNLSRGVYSLLWRREDPSETPVEVSAELWAGLQGSGQEQAPPRPALRGLSGRRREEQLGFAFFDRFEENNNP